MHAEGSAALHGRVQLEGLVLADEVQRRVRTDQDLGRRDPSAHVGARNQALRNDSLEDLRQLRPHLVLDFSRAGIDDTVDGLRRSGRMQRGEDEMSGFGRRDCRGNRFVVAHFSDEDDVRIFTKG